MPGIVLPDVSFVKYDTTQFQDVWDDLKIEEDDQGGVPFFVIRQTVGVYAVS